MIDSIFNRSVLAELIDEVTIADLAFKIIELTGANVGIDYIPYEKAYAEGFEDMER